MTSLSAIIDYLYNWAPPELAAPWNSIGLQIGDPNAPINAIHLSLDIDLTVLNILKTQPIDLVITHHPIFFKPIASINTTDDMGQIISTFITTNTHLLSLHTNLDAAVGGVNDALLEKLGFNREDGLPIEDEFGRYFQLSTPRSVVELATIMPARVVGAQQDRVSSVAVLAGSGHGTLKRVKALGINCFITGELTYHDEVYCELNGITAILLGHKESEIMILPKIKENLTQLDAQLTVTL